MAILGLLFCLFILSIFELICRFRTLDVLFQIVKEVPDLTKTGLGLSLAELPFELVPDPSKEPFDFRNFGSDRRPCSN